MPGLPSQTIGLERLLSHSSLGVQLALGSGACVALGALAEAAWKPGAKSRGLAFLLAGTSGCMVTAMLLEVVSEYRNAVNDQSVEEGWLFGIFVFALTLLLLIVAEWLMSQPLERLCRLQEALTRRAEQRPAVGATRGSQLADYVIDGWRVQPALTDVETAPVDPEEERAPTHEIVQGTREHANARHLRFLVRAILEQRLLEESLEDTVCRLAGRPIVELDVPFDPGEFHGVMRRLLCTSRTRSDLIWEELFKANDQNWPSLRVLAGAVQGHSRRMGRGFTKRDLAQEDELDYEAPPRALRALRFADRVLNGMCASSLPDGGSSPTSAMSDGNASGALRAQKDRTAHLRLIERVRPRLEVLLAAVGAAALHVFSGACLELVVMADLRTGVVLVVLLAVRNFPEGVVFAKEIVASLGGEGGPGRRRWACLAGLLVGLCDCIGAALAVALTKWTGKGLSSHTLGALYFVNGGLIVGLGIRKYLRAAVECDPENKLPTIAWMSGMVVCGVALVATDYHDRVVDDNLYS